MRSPREAGGKPDDGRGPRRTCIGCRQVRLKAELMRLVRRPDGAVVRDASGVGRGAYVCPDAACLERATQPGRLSHAFKRPSVPGPELASSGRRELKPVRGR
ncbi:MAG: YlxR family protein [Candidatus Rokuibacteriota bacterium]